MLRKIVKQMHQGEKGITGLETAIILIAFVVVAAVFAYTVLSAGMFATQKSQEAIYAGLEEARSTLELKGPVIATSESAGTSANISQVSFVLSLVSAGEPIDFTAPTANTSDNNGLAASTSTNKVVLSYVDKDQTKDDLYWTVTKLGTSDGDDLLEQNEKFEITIGSATANTTGGNLRDALTSGLSVNKTYSILVRPPVGAVLEIERTLPAYIDAIMNLH